MADERTSELMYDTAASLRLLDAELGELAPRRAPDAAAAPVSPPAPAPQARAAQGRALAQLPALLELAMGEVRSMLTSLREGREHLRVATTDRLSKTCEKLDEVTSATANAALDIMDALERAVAKVDDLETEAVLADPAAAAAIRGDLRDELFAVMGHMQFQDITSQQIMHVQSQLTDMETRLVDIAALFDPTAGEEPTPEAQHAARNGAFDANATLQHADARQALADSLVGRSGPAAS